MSNAGKMRVINAKNIKELKFDKTIINIAKRH